MGVWARLKRSVRALFGGIVEKTEDPELILQQTIRDMRDRVPELNNSVAQVMATEKLLAKSKERLEGQVVDLDSKIKAAVKMGRDDVATAYIGQLQQAQLDLNKTSQQLEHAGVASKQALKARDNYVLQMQRRTAEAMQLINQSKQAKLQEQLAQTMESFQLGDDASTFNEMRDKIDRRAAAAEAKMQLGAASVDSQMQEIEREALDMQLQDKLLDYKRQMGLLPESTGGAKPDALPAATEVEETERESRPMLRGINGSGE
jgi:phage shock protein A